MNLTLCLVLLCLGAAHARPPHIVFILADDFGWNDIGYHGSEIHTPILDQLAADGVKLENYYVQPICTPSRSQLLSGKYQIHTGLQHAIIAPAQPNGLPLDLLTLPDKLRQLGYATHIVGKWHLGFYQKEYLPTNRGFDSFFGILNAGADHYTHMICSQYPTGNACGFDLHRDLLPASHTYGGVYSTHIFADRAAAIITQHAENKAEQPLFLYLPFQAVHSPLQVPSSYLQPYTHIKDRNRRLYAGMVSGMDEAVGKVTSVLKQQGLWNDTLLVFSTDNGGDVYNGGNNYPLRGWKWSLWEGGMRGVGFAHGAMLQQTGVTNHELMHISDWFPTLVTLAGGDVSGLNLDGHDVWNSIRTGAPSPRTELLHNIDPLFPKHGCARADCPFDVTTRAAIRVGNWKLLTGDPGDGHWVSTTSNFTAQSDRKIPTSESDLQNVWLFDVAADPTERHDFTAARPDVVSRLLERLAAYNSTAVPCRFPPDDPQSNPRLHEGVWEPWRD